jgi:predicted nucleic acid binding AN1-type Zn finger protein
MVEKAKKECSFHLCDYEGENVYECPHCHKYYCKTHKLPKLSSIPNFKSNSDENDEALKNYRNENAHPCPDYYNIYINEKKEANRKYLEIFNKALKIPIKKQEKSDYLIKNYFEESGNEICDFCDKKFKNVFLCDKCKKYFCYEHSKPVDHDCSYIKNKYNKKENFADKDDEIRDFDGVSVNMTKYKESYKAPFKFESKGIIHFLKKYISFRIPPYISPFLKNFLYIFLIGLVINFVFYQQISISYLFLDGMTNTLNLFADSLSYNITTNNLFILIINIIFYFFFYSRFIRLIYHIIKNLDSWDVWKMLIWLILIGYLFFLIFSNFMPVFVSNSQTLIKTLNYNISNYFCSDWTLVNTCSLNKPFYCKNGTLIENISFCGCPYEKTVQGDECISIYQVNPKSATYYYMLKGTSGSISFTVYKGLNDYLANLKRSYTCYNNVCPSDLEIELREINNELQKNYLIDFVDLIKLKTTNKDDQARIAISVVQNIPYDYSAANSNTVTGRYPYEVLYDNLGVCGEKSKLLASLLKELGFGVALFSFDFESHMAVGIKCSSNYDYRDSGYCFIEATTPSIITDSEGDYVGAGKLTSTPVIYLVSEGVSMDVSQEYSDFQEWKRIDTLADNSPSRTINSQDYATWQTLVKKYGIKLE